jgi:hypothetical protein
MLFGIVGKGEELLGALPGALNQGAIQVLGNSHLELFSADVSGNLNSGVVARDNSSLRLIGDSISRNGGDGVRIIGLSSAALLGSNAASGNRGYDLSCARNTYAYGDLTGFGKNLCESFDDGDGDDCRRDALGPGCRLAPPGH